MAVASGVAFAAAALVAAVVAAAVSETISYITDSRDKHPELLSATHGEQVTTHGLRS